MVIRMIEEIGKVRLDLKHYPGEDYYCDGAVEDELLEITRNYAEVEYPRIIEERKSWPVLYHLSALRENIVDWLPIDKDMKVLEIGSGCGAITGALARKAGEVTCVDLSRKRSMINAYRHMDCENVTIHVGNFQDIEPDLPDDYDYICLIGVYEYAQAYMESEHPYKDFLRIIEKHRKNNGCIVIAIENKLGLKYWAGCKEDHLGTWFSSLEDYPEGGVVRTFTRNGLLKTARQCGFSDIAMYYPYPDYKFMTCLYSDDRLPRTGELSSNLRNFDRERLLLFDEKRVFDTVIKEEEFPLFSNSYLMFLGNAPEIKYAKYSNDRTEDFKIKTLLTESVRDGKAVRQMEKHALSKGAEEHIRQIQRAYEKLSERFEGGKLQINSCKLNEDFINSKRVKDDTFVTFEYLNGKTLEELLDNCLERNDLEGFHALFDEYLERISYRVEMETTDYDLIFANILITEDGQWHVIDYEWTFDKSVEAKEIAFRAIYCYLLQDEKRNKLNLDSILGKLGITESEAEGYRRQEMKFQKYVTGKRMSMEEIRGVIDQPIYALSELPMLTPAEKQKEKVQIYEDKGTGFSEEQSFFLEEVMGCERKFRLVFEGERKALRIDPCSDFCIVYLEEIRWNGKPVPLKGKNFATNGVRTGEGVYAFSTQDPNITLQLAEWEQKQENVLEVSMQVTKVPEETARHMQKRGLF